MSNEQRIADLERAVAMLMSALMQDEPAHFKYAEAGGRIQFVFNRRYDGGLDTAFVPYTPPAVPAWP